MRFNRTELIRSGKIGNIAGVHPSVIAVEVDNESSNDETSSSNDTVDYADAEPGPSDMVDMSSLPDESLGSVASNGAILVDDIIRAAQDQITSTTESLLVSFTLKKKKLKKH